jgi:non-specific serine/threonine protein kinase
MIGQILAHYRVISKLGEGGMGMVYKAEDVRLGRQVALKFLPDDLVNDRQALERFEREARAASALNHPHICTIHEVENHQGRPFIVMELVEGQTLRERLAGKLPKLSELLAWASEISDALAAAHAKGIAHRDIKSANLMLTPAGRIKVMDFGLAKQVFQRRTARASSASTVTLLRVADSITDLGTAVGTVAYMSPEQARGEPLDTRTDLFSLGVVLYEMTTGTLPFQGSTTAVVFEALLNKTPVAPNEVNPSVPMELNRIVMKLLEKDRDFRYQSAEELCTDLRRLQRDTQSGAAPAVAGRRRRRWWAPAGVAAAVVLLSIAAWNLGWFSRSTSATVPNLNPRQLTSNAPGNFVSRLAISPDGRYLAYSDLDGFYLRIVEGGETRRLPVPEGMCFR